MDEKTYFYSVAESEFEAKVIDRSLEVPILTLFWSQRSSGSVQLKSVLEKLATEFKGAFELAEMEAETAMRLVQMLQIQVAPTVYLFKEGQPVDAFQGSLSEKQVRERLAHFVEPPEQDPMEFARAAYAAGDLETAKSAFEAALQSNGALTEAHLGLARIALQSGDHDEAAAQLDLIPEEDSNFAAAKRLRSVFGFAEYAGEENAVRAALASDDSAENWYKLGATLVISGQYEQALDAFLEVVSRSRSYLEDGGRKAVVSLFDLIGPEDPAVLRARRRLASLLF